MNVIRFFWDGQEYILPAQITLCSTCEGDGHSSSYLGSWTANEWAEEDYEFQEDYFHGRYDKACPTCKGSGRVLVPANHLDTDDPAYKAYTEKCEDEAYAEAESRAERRMMGDY